MACPICNHDKREEIEQKLLCRTAEVGLDQIAQEYNVKVLDLQVHSIMHNSLIAAKEDPKAEPSTLVEKIRFKEGEYIRNTIMDYQSTLLILGTQIRSILRTSTVEDPTLHKIGKATVELYLGIGAEIRSSVDLLTKMNGALNGDSNAALNGLSALVTAIANSSQDKPDDSI